MNLTPAYDLVIGGTSILSRLQGRAVSISVTDQAGFDSDSLSIEIEAGARDIALPRKGAVISVSLGYVESGLSPMGQFTADEVRVTGVPVKIAISAKAADMRRTQKQSRTESYEKLTIGDIVGRIAARHGLAAAVGQDLAGIAIPYVAQTEESDLHFLTRLARNFGAVAAPKNGRMVFARRGQGKSVSGLALPALTLTPAQVSDFDFQMPDRPRVKTVKAHWHDTKAAERKAVTATAGGDDAELVLRHPFPTEGEAQAAADGKAADLKRAEGSFTASLSGNPQIKAEMRISTRGFYPGTDMEWTVSEATHDMSDGAFTTSITCEVA